MNPMSITDGLIDNALTFIRKLLDEGFFERNEKFFVTAAAYATPVAAVLGLVIAIVAAVKTDSLAIFMLGFAWVGLVVVSHFVGSRFLVTCKSIIENNRSTISTPEFLNVSALVMTITMLAAIVGGIYLSIKMSEVEPLYTAVPVSILLLYCINLVLNPSLISTQVTEGATAGEDAISISVIISKAAVKIAGIVFGSQTIIGSAFLAYSLVNVFKEDHFFGGITALLGGADLVILGLLYPFIIYIYFVFTYLIADLCRAVLTLHKR